MSSRGVKALHTERYTLKRVREFDGAEKELANYFAREVPALKQIVRRKIAKRKPIRERA
jgi:hypothetical protein